MENGSLIERDEAARLGEKTWTRALVALGSNLGGSAKNIADALTEIERTDGVVVEKTSSLYRTKAAGGPKDQPDFLNGAVLIKTTLGPFALLARLQEIEKGLRRVRKEFWGPRTIDLDLVFYGDLALSTPTLVLPHPRFFWRDFVLRPAVEIVPDWTPPAFGLTVEEIFALLRRSLRDYALLCRTIASVVRVER